MALFIGAKFCGGCAPGYHRRALLAAIRRELDPGVEIVPYDQGDPDVILIIAGCPSACVDRAPFADKKVFVVTKPGDADFVISKLKNRELEYTPGDDAPVISKINNGEL